MLNKLNRTLRRFADDEAGATAIEYGLIASLIAVAIIAGVTSLGGGLNNTFTLLAHCVEQNSQIGTACLP